MNINEQELVQFLVGIPVILIAILFVAALVIGLKQIKERAVTSYRSKYPKRHYISRAEAQEVYEAAQSVREAMKIFNARDTTDKELTVKDLPKV